MTAGGGGDSGIPAGYTYLGQFIDHDLTFDRTDVALGTDITPAEMKQARSPALDLDSLYGAGPARPGSQVLPRRRPAPADGPHRGRRQRPLAAHDGFDLPRTTPRKHARSSRTPRNDENLAVAQTHLAFIRFHNRVVGTLGSVPAAQRFKEARRLVVKHYQWMIRHDYLPRICDAAVVDDVFTNGRKIFEVGAGADQVPTMPIEFSVAAFRLGHSMIRRDYNWNKEFDDGSGALFLLFAFSGTSGDLGNGCGCRATGSPTGGACTSSSRPRCRSPAGKFNRARRIDTLLSNPLKELPPGSFGAKQPPGDAIEANLAFRNLARAKMVELATGQGMAACLQSKGVAVTPLTKAQIRDGAAARPCPALGRRQRDRVPRPHAAVVLHPARGRAQRRQARPASAPGSSPRPSTGRSRAAASRSCGHGVQAGLGPTRRTFDMRDLLFFAFEGKKALLAPLG